MNSTPILSLQRQALEEDTPLGPHFEPGPYDVICTRGKMAYHHPGNMHFRKLVKDHQDHYMITCTTKLKKTLCVITIVDKIRRLSPEGGGFVKFCDTQKCYVAVNDDKARAKVGHALRELTRNVPKTANKKGGAASKAAKKANARKDAHNQKIEDLKKAAAIMREREDEEKRLRDLHNRQEASSAMKALYEDQSRQQHDAHCQQINQKHAVANPIIEEGGAKKTTIMMMECEGEEEGPNTTHHPALPVQFKEEEGVDHHPPRGYQYEEEEEDGTPDNTHHPNEQVKQQEEGVDRHHPCDSDQHGDHGGDTGSKSEPKSFWLADSTTDNSNGFSLVTMSGCKVTSIKECGLALQILIPPRG